MYHHQRRYNTATDRFSDFWIGMASLGQPHVALHSQLSLFLVYQSTVLSSRAVDGHQMYSGGSVAGKDSTIGIEISPISPLIFRLDQKVRDLASFLLLIHYFTLWLWPLVFDLEHLQCVACDVMKLHTKLTQSSNPRRSYFDFSIWPNDLERRVIRVALDSLIIFTKFDLRQLIRAWIIAFSCWYVMSRCDLLTLNFYVQHFGMSCV